MEKPCAFDAPWKHRALEGDEHAIRQLVNATLEPLFRFCLYRVGRNRQLGEEVVQETLIRAITELPSYQPDRSGGNVFPWLTGLARNEIRRMLARERATTNVEAIWARMDEDLRKIFNGVESTPLPTDVLGLDETREIVNATMSQLPPHYRETLEAKYVSRFSVREIAVRQVTSEKAVESLLTRARHAFRETFLALVRNLNGEALNL